MFCLQCPRAGTHSARTNFKILTIRRRRRRTELWTQFAIKLYKSPRSGEKLVNTRSKHQLRVTEKKSNTKRLVNLKIKSKLLQITAYCFEAVHCFSLSGYQNIGWTNIAVYRGSTLPKKALWKENCAMLYQWAYLPVL